MSTVTYTLNVANTTTTIRSATDLIEVIDPDDLYTTWSATRRGQDLLIDFGGRGKIVVVNQFAGEVPVVGGIRYWDNGAWSETWFLATTLAGTQQNDVLVGTARGDYVTGADGDDVVFAGAGNDSVAGEAGDDTLDGGAGADALSGGSGHDTYVVDNAGDVVSETGADSHDLIQASIAIDLTLAKYDGIEDVELTGRAAINVTGDAAANRLTGNAAANVLDGGTGADVLIGGLGKDSYIVDNPGDFVIEDSALAGEIDAVAASVDYILGANVEQLTLTGTGNISGVGNELNNLITGNSASNYLDGYGGTDTLAGGLGDDRYIVDLKTVGSGAAAVVALQDVINEAANGGTDRVILRGTADNISPSTLKLAANLERLNASATGTTLLNLTGNTADNELIGNDADNVIDGGSGNDTLVGGYGDDSYVIDSADDFIYEAQDQGTDLVRIAIATAGGSYTLNADFQIENGELINTKTFSLFGNDSDNALTGNAAANTIGGGYGDDTLDGGAGIDRLDGGSGNDVYVIDSAGDAVSETGNDLHDKIVAGIGIDLTQDKYASIEDVELTGSAAINATGDAWANTLTGNAGANVIDGGAGADTLIGGRGKDTYIVDNPGDIVIETSALENEIDEVRSSVDYILGANVEQLTLTGIGNIWGYGNELGNRISGNSGNNLLDGGAGADTLAGGLGNDLYWVDLKTLANGTAALQDTVSEAANSGDDTIYLRGAAYVRNATTLTLAANLEHLDASRTGATRLNLTGNAADNTLTGNAAANVLNGGAGNDALAGGYGDDIYVIDSTGDLVSELSGQGNDLVRVAIATPSGSYTLSGALENATLINTQAFSLAGNGLDNVLTGNAAANTLTGNAGNDALGGGTGDDTLDGGAGSDKLGGGAGNDTYLVDNAGDLVTDNGGDGRDKIVASIGIDLNLDKYFGIEDVELSGTQALSATGNGAANTLTGNAAANTLDGGGGADTLIGGLGRDTYIVDDVNDFVSETSGLASEIDAVRSSVNHTLAINVEQLTLTGNANLKGYGNALDNLLTGNSGDNTLDGGEGADTLIGGLGNDTYAVYIEMIGSGEAAFAALQDTIIEAANGGIDTLALRGSAANSDYSTLTLAANLENLDAGGTGTTRLDLDGNSTSNLLVGNNADNVIDGGAGNDTLDGEDGADTLVGGTGNDVYYVDDTYDIVVETSSAINEIDRVYASASCALADNVEQLMLAGSGNIVGLGNALDNLITGNSGDNELDGGAGADTLIGGTGDDDYYVDLQTVGSGAAAAATYQDAIEEAPNCGNDSIVLRGTADNNSYATLTLAANVENLYADATATTRINLAGNALNNQLTGNDARNIIDGAEGSDTLIGGAGNDNLSGGAGTDRLSGGVGTDLLTGGADGDHFVFDTSDALLNADTLIDFASGVDKIDLSVSVFRGLGAAGTSLAADGIHLVYDARSGELSYDADGTGSGSGSGSDITFAVLGRGSHPASLGVDFLLIA